MIDDFPRVRALVDEHVEILLRIVDQESAQHQDGAYRDAWGRLDRCASDLQQPHPFADLPSVWSWFAELPQLQDDAARRSRIAGLVAPFMALLEGQAREATLFAVELYERNGNPDDVPYARFFNRLDRTKQISLYKAVELILRRDGKDVVKNQWGKNYGNGLFAFRIRHTADEIERITGIRIPPLTGPLDNDGSMALRVFFHPFGDRLLLILSGFDKGEDPKGEEDAIAEAGTFLKEWKLRQAAGARGS